MDRRSIARAAAMSMSSSGIKNSSTTAMRKGPWTEEEDEQLVRFVRLFGERRWDFLAKVSGLRRTGKSCRLRWVNYLHPGLRRGRITADEERLILQLHAQYGSRWSRIARSLPGRTDNEIKNFWRTRTRKHRAAQQQEKEKTMGRRAESGSDGDTEAAAAASSSPSSLSGTTTSDDCCTAGSPNSGGGGGITATSSAAPPRDDEATAASQQPPQEYTAMDQLWNEIAAADAAAAMATYAYAVDSWGACTGSVEPSMPPSPVWDLCSDYPLWKIDDEEYYKKMLDAS